MPKSNATEGFFETSIEAFAAIPTFIEIDSAWNNPHVFCLSIPTNSTYKLPDDATIAGWFSSRFKVRVKRDKDYPNHLVEVFA